MRDSDRAELHCPECGEDLATVEVEVRNASDRVVMSLIEQLTPIADGLYLPRCDECQKRQP